MLSIAALASRGLDKLDGRLLPTVPGGEAAALAGLDVRAARGAGRAAIILVGERMAVVPGALSAVLELATDTGARLAWVPRRAGERGAVDAGALPSLLPGGRPVSDDAARVEVERVWDAHVPTSAGPRPGRHPGRGAGRSPARRPAGRRRGAGRPARPGAAEAALAAAGFVVSLEIRHSAVTEHADVVLPVAVAAEKAGRFVTWEGRRRPFDLTLTNTGQLADGRVLHALADELDVDLGLPDVASARAELAALGAGTGPAGRPAGRAAAGHGCPATGPHGGSALLLASWHELIDGGRLTDGEPNLAGTAKPLRVVLAKRDRDASSGIADGDLVTVAHRAGSLTAPVELGRRRGARRGVAAGQPPGRLGA